MKEIPAPGAYFGETGKGSITRPRGPTFGISHKFYEKVTIPKESPEKTHTVRSNLSKILLYGVGLRPIVRNT